MAWVLLVVVVAAMIAFATRLFRINQWSLWGDEQYTWIAADMSLRDMWVWTSEDLHPPLYYAVVHGFVQLFGDSTTTLRAPSALASALTVVVLVLVATRAAGLLVGTLAGLLLMLNEAQILYSQEARMYPLTGLLALLTALAWALWEERPSYRRLLWLSLASVALLYTDYGGFFLVAILCAFTVVSTFGSNESLHRRDRFRDVGLWLLVIAVAYGPWWQHLFNQTERSTTGTVVPVPNIEFAAGVYRQALGFGGFSTAVWYVLGASLLTLGVLGVVRLSKSKCTLALSSLALVTVAQLTYSAFLPDLFDMKPVFDVKYTSPYVSGLAFVCAVGLIHGIPEVLGRIGVRGDWGAPLGVCIAAFLLVLMASNAMRYYEEPGPEDWRRPAANLDAGAPVYAWPNYILDPLRYYGGDSLEYRLLLQPVATAATQGYAPFPRTEPRSRVTFVGSDRSIQHAATIDAVIAASLPYFRIIRNEVHRPGLESWVLESTSISTYNVLLNEGDWATGSNGYLTSDDPATLDLDAAGTWSEGILLVEHRGHVAPLVATTELAGVQTILPSSTELMEAGWTRTKIPLALATSTRITLSAVGEVRRLEARVFHVSDGIIPVMDETQIGRAWFLRSDGFAESVFGIGCMVITGESADAVTASVESQSYGGWEVSQSRLERQGPLYCGSLPALRPIRSIVIESVD